jgi:hypothetical protein
MAVGMEIEQSLAAKFSALLPHLDERAQRLYLGSEARSLGHGGIAAVARAAGVSRQTVAAGVDEVESGVPPLGRVRRAGGGRKPVTETDPGLRPALLTLVDPDPRGDPESPLRWTTKSTRKLATTLTVQGHKVSADTVADLLRAEGFSLQGNVKTLEGKQNPDRDAQFRYLNEQVKDHQADAQPVISVDTKKKEQIGEFTNPGREWRPAGQPVEVNTHDFPDPAGGKAIPYGIYDLTANTGWVNVGTDHDTAVFAVESVRRWWNSAGRAAYPHARRLLITADAGGSNGYRPRAWKTELAALATQTGLHITVCHFPPGTSKWNAIEHRLFSHITMNWRGRPLTSHEVVVNTIAATTTRTGLTVHSELDTGSYPTGITISDQQMATLPIACHDWHGDWNYTLHPEQTTPVHPSPAPASPPAPDRTWLLHPALTGLSPTEWDDLHTQLTILRHAQQEATRHQQRGGPRRNKPGAGDKPTITLTDRTLAVLLRDRYGLTGHTLGTLLGVRHDTINKIIREHRPLLTLAGHTPEPTSTQLSTLADLTAYAINAGITPSAEIKSAC